MITNISADTPPIVTSTDHGLATGDIVNIASCEGALQLGSYIFTVTRLTADSFALTNMPPITAAPDPGPRARFYKVASDSIFIPPMRLITDIKRSNNRVTMSVTHRFTVGQVVRFYIPLAKKLVDILGIRQLNLESATVIAIDQPDEYGYTNTIDVDLDMSTFDDFSFPNNDNHAFIPAHVVPVGEDIEQARRLGAYELAGAIRNRLDM